MNSATVVAYIKCVSNIEDLFMVRRRLTRFQTETDFVRNGIPHIVHVRPDIIGNDDDEGIFNTISRTLRSEIRRRIIDRVGVRNYRPENIGGYLSAENVFNATTITSERFMHVSGITPEALLTIVEQIQKSNEDVLLTDLQWNFTLDPTTFIVGGNSKVKPPSWVTQKYKKTWQPQPVNCAAYSLCFLMYHLSRRYRRDHGRHLLDAKALQEELGWGDFINSEQLFEFVKKYKKYRLTILFDNSVLDKAAFYRTGSEYDGSKQNSLYLIYDPVQQHYGTELPLNVAKGISNTYDMWCHHCQVAYNHFNCNYLHTDEAHQGLPVQRVKKVKVDPKPCIKCNEFHGSWKCSKVTCKTCETNYGKGTSHRCIVSKKFPEEEQKWLSVGDAADGSLPALWAYDFESCIEITEENRLLTDEFIVDENGRYIVGTPTEVTIMSKKVKTHKVNAVDFENLKTGEKYQYTIYDQDPNCLERFVIFMTTFNRGNNICFAHNASGYDSRLLFEQCKKIRNTTQIMPIMRGGKFMQIKLATKNGRSSYNTLFRDSLLHLKGSLASIAKDFCDDGLEKGHFPHLFNTPENYHYSGVIPDLKYFDFSFSARSEDAYKKCLEWYEERKKTPWDFKTEFLKYLRTDVKVLAIAMNKYDEILYGKFKMSPW